MNVLIKEGFLKRNEFLVDVLNFFVDSGDGVRLHFKGDGYVSFFDVSVFLDQHAFEFVDDCDADFVSRIMACFNDISFVQFVTYGVFKKLVDLYISDTGVVIDLVSLVSLQVRSELETFETCV